MESLLRSLVSKFVSPFSALALVSIGAQFLLLPLLLPDLPESSLDLLSLLYKQQLLLLLSFPSQ